MFVAIRSVGTRRGLGTPAPPFHTKTLASRANAPPLARLIPRSTGWSTRASSSPNGERARTGAARSTTGSPAPGSGVSRKKRQVGNGSPRPWRPPSAPPRTRRDVLSRLRSFLTALTRRGALRGWARCGGAVSPGVLHGGPDPFGGTEGGSGAARTGPLRLHREHEGRLPARARPAAHRRAPAGRPLRNPRTAAQRAVRVDRDRFAGPRHWREHGDLLVRGRHPASAAAGRRAGASRDFRADTSR